MGLTEGHWFEDEEQLTERQLERAVEDENAAYKRGLHDGKAGFEWINVRDRLPESHQQVLVYGVEAIGNTPIWGVKVNDNGVWRPQSAPSCIWAYWMPLPEPPEEEE